MMGEVNGTAEAARRLIRGLAKAGHKVRVFAPSIPSDGVPGIEYYRTWGFRMSLDPEFHFNLPLKRYVDCRNNDDYRGLDICHVMTPMTLGWLGIDVAMQQGIPRIATHHSPLQYYAGYFPVIGKPFSLYAWTFERFIYNRFHCIHVPTISKKALIMQHHIKEPIFALTNGIPDEYFRRASNARDNVIEQYGIDPDRKIILYAGRQGPEKNIEAIVRAFRAVRDRGIDAHLILAGGGPYIPFLKNYAAELGVADRVTQTGYVETKLLRQIYDAADVSTLYNDIEAQGLVLLEAMAQGTPCVGKRANGIKNVIIDGKTGYLVDSEKEFAERIISLLQDDESREAMGRAALDVVARNHKMEKVIETWERIYKFVIDVIYPLKFYHTSRSTLADILAEFCEKDPLLAA